MCTLSSIYKLVCHSQLVSLNMKLLCFLTCLSNLEFTLARLPTLANPENHYYHFTNPNRYRDNHRSSLNSVFSVNPSRYSFIVMTDPQFGKYDQELGGDGLNWDEDMKHVNKMCSDLVSDSEDIAFIMVAGDMADALPVENSYGGVAEPYDILGRQEPLRPAETTEFLDTMRNCPASLPVFTITGNRDIGNDNLSIAVMAGYERQFMELFYHYQIGNRYFIAIDCQVYKINDEIALEYRKLFSLRNKASHHTIRSQHSKGKSKISGLNYYLQVYHVTLRKQYSCILGFTLNFQKNYMQLTKINLFDQNIETI